MGSCLGLSSVLTNLCSWYIDVHLALFYFEGAMMNAEPDIEVHCLRAPLPSINGLRRARAFFHDLPGRSGFGSSASGTPASMARVSFVTRENVERSFIMLREGHQLDRTELQHVQVWFWCHSMHQIAYGDKERVISSILLSKLFYFWTVLNRLSNLIAVWN